MLSNIIHFFRDYSGVIIAASNIVLIIVIIHQARNQKKAIVGIKILSSTKDVSEIPNVLEREEKRPNIIGDALYLVVSNLSDNLASSLKIRYKYKILNKVVGIRNGEYKGCVKLSYLNPKEAARFLFPVYNLLEKNPDIFMEIRKKDESKKIPKKTIKMEFNISVSYSPILGFLRPHRTRDSYYVKWGGINNYRRFKDHPIVLSWNKRDNLYIYKIK